MILLLAIAGVMLLLVVGTILWFHRTNQAPKTPLLHSVRQRAVLPTV